MNSGGGVEVDEDGWFFGLVKWLIEEWARFWW